MDWQAFLFDPNEDWIKYLETVSRRHFYDDNLADAAFNYAFGEMQKGDWAKLNKFQGKSKPSTFLTTVFKNLLRDYDISVNKNKCRPPVWVDKLGDMWKQVYKYLCCRYQNPSQVVEQLGLDSPATDIKQAATQILAKIPRCQEKNQRVSEEALHSSDPQNSGDADEPESSGQQYLWRNMLEALGQLMELDQDTDELADQLAASGRELSQAIRLNEQQMLLLKLHFQDGLSISKAARELNIADHKARKELAAALILIREQLAKLGIEKDSLF